MEYVSETGYVAKDVLSGVEISDSSGNFICELQGALLCQFEDENGDINDDLLCEAVRDELDVEDFIEYQQQYC